MRSKFPVLLNPPRHNFLAGRTVAMNGQHGVVLLEALIAILIFSMGILAVVGLQAAMIKNTSDSKYRADASYIAQQRVGQIWVDQANLASYAETDTDISDLLPGGLRSTNRDGVMTNQFTVTVTWQQPGSEDVHTFTTVARIAGG
jgi:type IV pilus assembly protein PilV